MRDLLAFGARVVSGARVHWLERPIEARPRVYFANHSSHLDFVVLWSALPAHERIATRPVAAKEYWQRTPWRSFLATHIFRSLLVPREDAAALAGRATLAPLLEELDRGGSLILFPEGTRGDGRELGGFRAGLYELCRLRPHVEAVPVWLENLHRVLPKGRVLPVPHGTRVVFGEALRIRSDEGREFLGRARDALLQLKDR
jgi:1-acyl-sn-glycerol-3-phosphate acyltransferase